jgi:hypothetical protein
MLQTAHYFIKIFSLLLLIAARWSFCAVASFHVNVKTLKRTDKETETPKVLVSLDRFIEMQNNKKLLGSMLRVASEFVMNMQRSVSRQHKPKTLNRHIIHFWWSLTGNRTFFHSERFVSATMTQACVSSKYFQNI